MTQKEKNKKKRKYIERFQYASQQFAMAIGAALFWDANLKLFENIINRGIVCKDNFVVKSDLTLKPLSV